ncbi:MAG: hypothetical protein AB1333_04515 [Patescibacteria group bacterium]
MGFLKTAKCCVLPIFIVILVIGAFILFSYFPIEDQRGFFGWWGSEKKEITQKTDDAELFIKLTELSVERIGPRVCASGAGINMGTTTIGYVRVFIAFLDINNETVDFGGGDVLSAKKIIRPGEEFSFTRCVDDSQSEIDEKNYKLFFEGKIGTNYQSRNLLFTQ